MFLVTPPRLTITFIPISQISFACFVVYRNGSYSMDFCVVSSLIIMLVLSGCMLFRLNAQCCVTITIYLHLLLLMGIWVLSTLWLLQIVLPYTLKDISLAIHGYAFLLSPCPGVEWLCCGIQVDLALIDLVEEFSKVALFAYNLTNSVLIVL